MVSRLDGAAHRPEWTPTCATGLASSSGGAALTMGNSYLLQDESQLSRRVVQPRLDGPFGQPEVLGDLRAIVQPR